MAQVEWTYHHLYGQVLTGVTETPCAVFLATGLVGMRSVSGILVATVIVSGLYNTKREVRLSVLPVRTE